MASHASCHDIRRALQARARLIRLRHPSAFPQVPIMLRSLLIEPPVTSDVTPDTAHPIKPMQPADNIIEIPPVLNPSRRSE
ncbi:hypothetical protein GCM10023346_18390 [Arthrobacter gyeryongensis]|uniref:Uncharacterized protein n=1 Tax=Arthrobacter gyeryongensis TaxID=1650592 RepID=A0ABP9SAG9_9MICC